MKACRAAAASEPPDVFPQDIVPIDYLAQSEKYRPRVIETLLVGEAPPPSGTKYFYLPTTLRRNVPIERNRSLPATIFHHYFKRLPRDEAEYHELLLKLQELGVFLVDILDEPTRIRGSEEGIRRVIAAIPHLRSKLRRRDIQVEDERVAFLLARGSYKRWLRDAFPRSTLIRWIDFRMGT